MSVSSDHLRSLARVEDDVDATELLPLAVDQSPEEFASTASRFLTNKDGATVRDRPQAERSVRFFATDNGGVGMRAILTELEGAGLTNPPTVIRRAGLPRLGGLASRGHPSPQ